jgi:hypothetical protein
MLFGPLVKVCTRGKVKLEAGVDPDSKKMFRRARDLLGILG